MNKQQEPRLRFKGFSGEWKTEGFESVGEFNPKAEIPQIFQYVDLESVVGTQLISYREEFKETAPSRAQRLAKNGDLFFQAVRPYQKNNYLFEKNNENFVFSTGYIQIRSQNDGYFLLTLVQKEEFVQEVLLRCTGTSYPAINTSSLQNIAILIPPTAEEQTHLGLFFRRLDNQIAESRAVLEKSRQLKKAMLAKMFPENGEKLPKIRFKGFEGEWETYQICDLFRITRGNVLATTNLVDNKNEDYCYPVYSSQTKNKGLMGYWKHYLFENAITWTTDGANAGDVNFRSGKFYCTNVCGILINEEGFANQCIAEILNLVTHSYVSYVGNPKLMNNVMAEIPILIPPTIKEQTAIGNFFRQLDETIALQSAEVEKLNQLKNGLLAAMLV